MQSLRNLFSCFWPHHYDELVDQSVKKDDDLGVEEASSWIKLNPIDQDISNSPIIKEKARQIVEGLEKVPLTDSNYQQVRNHLQVLAKTSTMLRYYLIQEITKSKILKNSDDLLNAVEMAYSNNL